MKKKGKKKKKANSLYIKLFCHIFCKIVVISQVSAMQQTLRIPPTLDNLLYIENKFY